MKYFINELVVHLCTWPDFPMFLYCHQGSSDINSSVSTDSVHAIHPYILLSHSPQYQYYANAPAGSDDLVQSYTLHASLVSSHITPVVWSDRREGKTAQKTHSMRRLAQLFCKTEGSSGWVGCSHVACTESLNFLVNALHICINQHSENLC